MYALSVFLDIVPEHVPAFKAAALVHAANTLGNEAGCLAFEIFQSPNNPARFFFYECYTHREAVEEVHNKAAYLAEFGKKTAPWVIKKEIAVWNGAAV